MITYPVMSKKLKDPGKYPFFMYVPSQVSINVSQPNVPNEERQIKVDFVND